VILRLDNPETQATLGTRQRTRKTNNTTQNTKSISNMGDQNPYITEEQTKQWSKEKGQNPIFQIYFVPIMISLIQGW
jgi:hypothetical protein